MSGTYAHTIRIKTQSNLTINITGPVTFTGNHIILLGVYRVGTLIIHSEGQTVRSENSGDLLSLEDTATTAEVTVSGGIWSGYGAPVFYVGAGTLNLNNVSVVNPEDASQVGTDSNAVNNHGGTVSITGGIYSGNGTAPTLASASGTMTVTDATVTAEKSNAVYNLGGTVELSGKEFTTSEKPTIYTKAGAETKIHSGTYKRTGSSGQVFMNQGTLTIDERDGKTLILNPEGTSATVVSNNTLNFNGGTVTAPNSSAIVTIGSTATTTITGGTVKDSKYGVEVRRENPTVVLENMTFTGNENDIYLGADQTITIADSFTGRASVKAKEEPVITPRPVTTATATNYQSGLDLVSADPDYAVAYGKNADGTEYRYLTTDHAVATENAVAKADLGSGEQTLTDADFVAAGTEVTATPAEVPGKSFTGWTLTVNGTEDNSLLQYPDENDHTRVRFTMPNRNVELKANYKEITFEPAQPVNDRHIVTIANGTAVVEGSSAAAADRVEVTAGAKLTVTPAEKPGLRFTGWEAEGVELADPTAASQTFTMPDHDVTMTATYDIPEPDPDPSAPVNVDDPLYSTICGAIESAMIGGTVVWGVYEAGTGLYRKVNMAGIILPTTRAELALLIWERAGEPEPETAALYDDIDEDDTDLQKAAHWMVEQELMDEKDDNKFAPAAHVTKLRVCTTWDKAKRNGLFE